jgi:hypothetical protein
MKKLTSLMIAARLSAVALCLASLSFPNEAQAAVPHIVIRLDNSSNGRTITSTGTNSTITVRARFCGEWQTIDIPRALPSAWEDWEFWEPDGYPGRVSEIDQIEVSIDGSDWFWLDQIKLLVFVPVNLDYDGYYLEQWSAGADNLQGWCLSTDPSDGNDTICQPNGSRPRFVWTVPGSSC